ncbi:MAG: FkbM family methyltransferase [Methanoregula sp.]|jgi:FkbM family methyltransferase|uniref:FkbM family methyltransferase n=1 Tax=Methanoregula sp. TaxID=2052170 RepID=UPI003C148FA7
MKIGNWVREQIYNYKLKFRLKTKFGLTFLPPNLAFFNKFNNGDYAIDVGCGDYPDFSLYCAKKHGMHVVVIDPTRKHFETLKKFERANPLLTIYSYALGHEEGTTTFFESTINRSGSLCSSHRNIVNDPVVSYQVSVITLEHLIHLSGVDHIKIIKIDIEGEEYKLIGSLTKPVVEKIDQIIIEFHHYAIEGFTKQDTAIAIHKMEALGMRSIQYTDSECLFFWKETI